MNEEELSILFSKLTTFKKNQYHPLTWIVGEPEIGENVYIGGMSEINANHAKIKIGNDCDIASFVSINCADSHKKCLELSEKIERKDITIDSGVSSLEKSVIFNT